MGTTPAYALRFPETGDPPNGPADLATLAGDVDAALAVARDQALAGVVGVPVPHTGWAWLETHGGTGTAVRHGDVVTVAGLLRRTGAPAVLNTGYFPAITLPWQGHRVIGQSGIQWSSAGPVRWFITEGQPDLGIMSGTAGTMTIPTGGQLSVCVTYLTGAPGIPENVPDVPA
jgi:hypothetical protein